MVVVASVLGTEAFIRVRVPSSREADEAYAWLYETDLARFRALMGDSPIPTNRSPVAGSESIPIGARPDGFVSKSWSSLVTTRKPAQPHGSCPTGHHPSASTGRC